MHIRKTVIYVAVFTFFISCTSEAQQARFLNGFELKDTAIPIDEIHRGGPPRDGIPSIDKPVFLKAEEATYLRPDDRILGVKVNGIAKAYPIRIMDWHEIVNDDFAGKPVVITYCPLCGSGLTFSASIKGKKTEFGVSGLLYNSDVLLYDRTTESLWSQLESKAVSGKLKGEKMKFINTANTTWLDWRKRNPNTLVLSTATGYNRDYNRSPYGGYALNKGLYFPVNKESDLHFQKELVIGVEINGKYKAYPFSELLATEQPVITDRFNGKSLKIHFNAADKSARIEDDNGDEQNTFVLYWFAWYAFHPEASVYNAKNKN